MKPCRAAEYISDKFLCANYYNNRMNVRNEKGERPMMDNERNDIQRKCSVHSDTVREVLFEQIQRIDDEQILKIIYFFIRNLTGLS